LPNRSACHSIVVEYATFFLASTFANGNAKPGFAYTSPAFAMSNHTIVVSST
jgi:hypothetical protein